MWSDKSFPYKALMFAKCSVSVRMLQLRNPDGLKIVPWGCLESCDAFSGAGEIQVKGGSYSH